jgi:hypothetical protein
MSNHATPTPLYVPMTKAQATFGPSRVTFYRAAKAGKINIYHAGHAALLKVSEVEAWLSVRINGEKT